MWTKFNYTVFIYPGGGGVTTVYMDPVPDPHSSERLGPHFPQRTDLIKKKYESRTALPGGSFSKLNCRENLWPSKGP
jgi:hypothetical protein